jgi:hypothetical protein
MPAMLRPAARCSKIHRTHAATAPSPDDYGVIGAVSWTALVADIGLEPIRRPARRSLPSATNTGKAPRTWRLGPSARDLRSECAPSVLRFDIQLLGHVSATRPHQVFT